MNKLLLFILFGFSNLYSVKISPEILVGLFGTWLEAKRGFSTGVAEIDRLVLKLADPIFSEKLDSIDFAKFSFEESVKFDQAKRVIKSFVDWDKRSEEYLLANMEIDVEEDIVGALINEFAFYLRIKAQILKAPWSEGFKGRRKRTARALELPEESQKDQKRLRPDVKADSSLDEVEKALKALQFDEGLNNAPSVESAFDSGAVKK